MRDSIQDVLRGNVGLFWPQDQFDKAELDEQQLVRGYIHRSDEEAVEVRALDESTDFELPFRKPARPRPVALFGAAEKTGLLLPELTSAGHSMQFGGSRASIRWYRANAVITDVDLRDVASSRLSSASLVFAEGLEFAGQSAMTQSVETDPTSHRVTSATFTLESQATPTPGGRYGPFDLTLEPDWSSSGDNFTVTVRTGLSVELSVEQPRPFSEFRPLLTGVQDLLNLAYDRFVPALSGRATVHSRSVPQARPRLWVEDAMVPPAHSDKATKKNESNPLFTLADLGGPSGLRRWLKLRDQFPDAAVVVAAGHRHGGSRQPGRLMEVAAAIEFYVNSNRRLGAVWARKASAPNHAEALARRVGVPFSSLVGDHVVWAERFRGTYNGVKHDPSFLRDPEELQLLAWSGQVLLLTALLDRAAGTKSPSRRILQDYRLQGGAKKLRSIIHT